MVVLVCTTFSMVAHLLIHKRQFRSEVVLPTVPAGPFQWGMHDRRESTVQQ